MVNPGSHIFWITSRAAGTTALLTSSASVMVGVAQSGGLVRLRRRGPELRALHEILSLVTLACVLVHGLTLLADGWLSPSIVQVVVPFTASYRTVFTGIGIIAAYGLAALSLTYYARARIGPARWRKMHRFVAVFWIAGLVHSIGAGTDSGTWWFLGLLAFTTVPAVVILFIRQLPRGRGAPAPALAMQGQLPATESRGSFVSSI